MMRKQSIVVTLFSWPTHADVYVTVLIEEGTREGGGRRVRSDCWAELMEYLSSVSFFALSFPLSY